MKNNITKIISFALCIIMVFALALPAFADSEETDDVYKNYSYRFGDLNGDSNVTAADARLCLQASASLIELSEKQINAANVLGESGWTVNSSCARKILRVAAKIDTFKALSVHLYEGFGYVIGPLTAEDGKNAWSCEVNSNNGLEVNETVAAPQMLGCADIMQTFTFIAKQAGNYKVSLKLKASWETEIIDEINFTVVVDKLPVGGLIWDDWDVILEHLDTDPYIFEGIDGKTYVLNSWISFDDLTGVRDASVTIGGDALTSYFSDKVDPDEFERLIIGDSEVKTSDYTVLKKDGKITITLKEKYVKTLEDGLYVFGAEFEKAVVPLRLYVVTHKVKLADAEYTFNNGLHSKVAWAFLDCETYPVAFYGELFEKLTYKGEAVDPANYVVTGFEDMTVIMLTDAYVKTLPAGEHYFEAEFMNADVMLKLNVE